MSEQLGQGESTKEIESGSSEVKGDAVETTTNETKALNSQKQKKAKKQKPKPIKVFVHVDGLKKDEPVRLHVKDGTQTIKWLALVATARVNRRPNGICRQRESNSFSGSLLAENVTFGQEGDEYLSPTSKICDTLKDGDHIYLKLGRNIKVSVAQNHLRSNWASEAFSSKS